eukprot:scaffold124569_cov27-Tisochrysis_lutea.AAC.2
MDRAIQRRCELGTPLEAQHRIPRLAQLHTCSRAPDDDSLKRIRLTRPVVKQAAIHHQRQLRV